MSSFPISDHDRAVGRRVTVYREALGLSQKDVARLLDEAGLGWWQATVYRVESGQRALRIGEAMLLADVFRVSLDELTGRNGGNAETGAAYARLLEVRHAQRELGARERELLKLVT